MSVQAPIDFVRIFHHLSVSIRACRVVQGRSIIDVPSSQGGFPCISRMDLLQIGAQCALSTCNVNDFLPIRCRCDGLFCQQHISPELHSCSRLSSLDMVVDPNIQTSTQAPLQRCAADKCNKPSLEAFISGNSTTVEGRSPEVCRQCKLAFCAT